MAYTQADLDKIDAAMISGQKKVTFADGRSVENYDLDQLRRLRADVHAGVVGQSAGGRRNRFIVGRMCRR
jgi:hypothetical protein